LTSDQLAALRTLFEFSESNADEFFWGQGKRGSFNPRFASLGPHALFNAYFDGTIDVNLRSTKDGLPGQSVKARLRERLNQIGFGPVPEDSAYYRIKVEAWTVKVDDLIQMVQDLRTFAEQLQSATPPPAQ